jgi:hypothetical protein
MTLDERKLFFRLCGCSASVCITTRLGKKTNIPSSRRTFAAHEHVHPENLHITEISERCKACG